MAPNFLSTESRQKNGVFSNTTLDIANKDTKKLKTYKIIKNNGLETLFLNPEKKIKEQSYLHGRDSHLICLLEF